MKCRNCGDEVDPRRVELGYDYCTRRECQERLMKRVELARVTVNKAADQYVRAEEVVPRAPGRGGASTRKKMTERSGRNAASRSPRPSAG